jgi:hypothetical protein
MSAFTTVPSVDFYDVSHATFVSRRARPCKSLTAMEEQKLLFPSEGLGTLLSIQGPEPFVLCLAQPNDRSLSSVRVQLHSEPFDDDRRHVLHFPHGLPVGCLKYSKGWVHCTTPRDDIRTAQAAVFTVTGEVYDAEDFEALEAATSGTNHVVVHMQNPSNVLAFTHNVVGCLYIR